MNQFTARGSSASPRRPGDLIGFRASAQFPDILIRDFTNCASKNLNYPAKPMHPPGARGKIFGLV
jgi:hypothetical protein